MTSPLNLRSRLDLTRDFLGKQRDLLNKKDFSVVQKYKSDVATEVDGLIERNFSDFVLENFPEDGFLGEELPELRREGELTWVIDPIDGTKYFAKNIPLWAVTISLLDSKNNPLLGIVSMPHLEQDYFAVQGEGSFLDDVKINVVQNTLSQELKSSQVAWDQSYDFGQMEDLGKSSIADDYMKIWKSVYRFRALGNGSVSLCWVTQGVFSAYIDLYRPKSKFLDIAGGILIAKEAGFRVSVTEIDKDHDQILVSTDKIFEQIVNLFPHKNFN